MKRRHACWATAALALLSLAIAAAPTAAAAEGTKIRVRGSDFGSMIWAPGRQAVYMFENDESEKSHCYGRCAKAWPPVLTKGRPRRAAASMRSCSAAPGAATATVR